MDDHAPGKAFTARRVVLVLGSLLLIGGVLVARLQRGDEPAQAASQGAMGGRARTPDGDANRVARDVVALVNSDPISREDLARECLRHYGKDVLECVVNKLLIAQECSRRGIEITRDDVDAEIARMAKRFSLPTAQWYKLLEEERGIKPAQYANDIIWPMLALRKLAGPRLTATPQELQEAYDSQFGPAVRARLIASSNPERAEKLRAAAMADPEKFGELAKKYSVDTPSASDSGWIPPIRKNVGHKQIEDTVFAMTDGQISSVIKVENLYLVLKRETLIPARKIPLDRVKPQLQTIVETNKIRDISQEVFAELQKTAKLENHLNDPAKRGSGVAATLNGKPITVRQLAEECVSRHGEETLDGMINRKLLEQACKKQGVTVTKDELRQEVSEAAAAMVPPKADGTPDIEAWIKLITQQQGVSEEVYLRDTVWPSVALRKLARPQVTITEEDVTKSLEANYGPRAKCLAIVLDDLRRAQKVWAEAREKPTAEHFGDLAEQYSIEATSKKLRGHVPEIKRHGGQPVLEQEIFNLKPGELSGIIQVDDKYVIMLCLGFTERIEVDKESVRGLIQKDLQEKKLSVAMSKFYQQLRDHAAIDNFLTGVSQKAPEIQQTSATAPLTRLQPPPRRTRTDE